jgi:peroxiredoxin Q/BCP
MNTTRRALVALVVLTLTMPVASRVRAGCGGEAPMSPPATSSMPTIGQAAPDFTLPSTSGKAVTLSKLRGRTVVLYFYPKDETAGCTREACDFRDRTADLQKAGVVVLGVSSDNLKSHQHFTKKEKLSFPLLADVKGAVAALYGVPVTRVPVSGGTYFGRTTFVIDKEGRIARVWPKVSVVGHVDEVLKFVNTGA